MGIVVAYRGIDVDNGRGEEAKRDIRGTALFCAKLQARAATLLAFVRIVE